MEVKEEKISTNTDWEKKYKELKSEYDWLWEEWKKIVKKFRKDFKI